MNNLPLLDSARTRFQCFKKRNRLLIAAVVLAAIAALVVTSASYLKRNYPFGWSHCCILAMSTSLDLYADANGGRYPAGESSPEASLSLLCRSNGMDAFTLRGMTVRENTARRILEGGGLLGPDSCGWQYVDDLTRADDPRIALLYCKQALGHNGQRTKDGGRQVVFVGGDVQWVSGYKWPAFLQEQKELLLARSERARTGAPLVTAVIELPDGTRRDHADGPCTLRENGSTGFGTRSSSGEFVRSELVWFQAPVQDGYVTRTLSFSNLISDPVTIRFTNGIPDATNCVFRMKIAR
jgi:hypothetical protein